MTDTARESPTASFAVRTALPDDADALARAHVEGWRVGYRGILPQGHLDAIDEPACAGRWRGHLAAGNTNVLVVERGQDVVGFAAAAYPGPGRPEGEAQVRALYVRPSAWGSGAADTLMTALLDALAGVGCTSARLNVLAGNPRARRFYERSGWVTGDRVFEIEIRQPGMPSPLMVDVVDYTHALL